MTGEDEAERLLRLISERRQEFVDKLAHGGISPDNVPGGYLHTSGHILGLDMAADLVRDVFRGWLPQPPPKPAEPRKIGDY